MENETNSTAEGRRRLYNKIYSPWIYIPIFGLIASILRCFPIALISAIAILVGIVNYLILLRQLFKMKKETGEGGSMIFDTCFLVFALLLGEAFFVLYLLMYLYE